MKKIILPLFIIITASFGFAPANTVTRSAITFQTKNMGIGVSGTISGLQANVQFNPADLAASTVEATVDVNTINTDNSTRDDHLKTDEFFDAAHYPKIILKSVSFKHRNGSNYTGAFNLTIKNKTKLVVVPFTFTKKGNDMAFKGSFKLNRLDFGIGTSSLVLSDEVMVNIDAVVGD